MVPKAFVTGLSYTWRTDKIEAKQPKVLELILRGLDSTFLITNICAQLLPRKYRKTDKIDISEKGKLIHKGYIGPCLDVLPTICEGQFPKLEKKEYFKVLNEWKSSWARLIRDLYSYSLTKNESVAGFYWTQKPDFFLKHFNIFFPVPEALKNKFLFVKSRLQQLLAFRLLLLEAPIQKYDLDGFLKDYPLIDEIFIKGAYSTAGTCLFLALKQLKVKKLSLFNPWIGNLPELIEQLGLENKNLEVEIEYWFDKEKNKEYRYFLKKLEDTLAPLVKKISLNINKIRYEFIQGRWNALSIS